jgi:hypothetical protein
MLKNNISNLLLFLSFPFVLLLLYIFLSVPLYQLKIIIKSHELDNQIFTEIFSQYLFDKYKIVKLNNEVLPGTLIFYIESKSKSDLQRIEETLKFENGPEIPKNKNSNYSYKLCSDDSFHCFIEMRVQKNNLLAYNAMNFLTEEKLTYEINNVRPKPLFYALALSLIYLSFYLIFKEKFLLFKNRKKV